MHPWCILIVVLVLGFDYTAHWNTTQISLPWAPNELVSQLEAVLLQCLCLNLGQYCTSAALFLPMLKCVAAGHRVVPSPWFIILQTCSGISHLELTHRISGLIISMCDNPPIKGMNFI